MSPKQVPAHLVFSLAFDLLPELLLFVLLQVIILVLFVVLLGAQLSILVGSGGPQLSVVGNHHLEVLAALYLDDLVWNVFLD